jgi:hypothetical protein
MVRERGKIPACDHRSSKQKLHSESGCEHLLMLNLLASSSDASLLDEIPMEVQKIAGWLVRKWCRPSMVCQRLLVT